MHEHSLTSGLIRKIESLAHDQHAARVVTVNVVLGALSNISADHFREHFDAAARGTLAESALLTVRESGDLHDPNALHVVLESVEFEE
jgi:hydrogenase nickel incorporation protein HypA/HybF